MHLAHLKPRTQTARSPVSGNGSRGVVLLGSTGSIGRSTLDVLRRQSEHFHVVALTAGRNQDELESQVAEWSPSYAGLAEASNHPRWPTGPQVLVEAATHPDADIVVNAVVGAAGLEATLAALQAGKRVALANKESLVMAGDLVNQAACAGRGEVVPIDSEHSAVLQCVTGREQGLARLILTASGGPFREWPADRVWHATVEEALNHPTWRMGHKITVDCATLANKALELIEAHYLFHLPYDSLEVVVHPQSIIHAFAEFWDGSVLAQVGFPSMELPILYALTHPERLPDQGVRRFDPVAAGPLTFEPVRRGVFRALECGIAAGRIGGTAPAVFNAANEVAVAAFLRGSIPFGRISETIEHVLEAHAVSAVSSVEAVRTADRWARTMAEQKVGTSC
ncbi:MAG TPA: 1-deoxy-D-xylulose-5-phosphate reductoisomerase [Gemmatimonadales bacterium]|jgi:1-deoxy-D-xylulose-5-phosphate reductoisomerase|nr:1-deoxy-D-xylulose-5-phosphate reductoisomerase [Gemmatimonadales bacterium]